MKILHVCNRFYPAIGGVEEHVLNLGRKEVLKANVFEVLCSDFIKVNTKEKFETSQLRGEIDGIQYKRLKGLRLFNSDPMTWIPALPFYLIKNVGKFDIVHAHSYGYFVSWVTILICTIKKVPVVYTPHYADETVQYAFVKKIYDALFAGWSFRMATRVIALTKTESNILIKKFRVQSDKIVIIPNGINLATSLSKPKSISQKKKFLATLGVKNENRNVVIVARIAKNKGHIYLLQAVEKIVNVNLLIVGKDWGEKQNLIDYIQAHKMQNVYFLGNINDEQKSAILKISDVFALASIGGEAFGIVLLEAMAAGTPVVATSVGGVPDLVEDKKNGLLVPPKDSQMLSDAIVTLLEDDKLRSEISKNNLAKAQLYSWGFVSDEVNKVYKDYSEDRNVKVG